MKNISAGTITRAVMLLIALANQFATMLGYSPLPFDNELISQVIAVGFTAVTSVIAFWKNNSITKEAIEADTYLQELRLKSSKEGGQNGQ